MHKTLFLFVTLLVSLIGYGQFSDEILITSELLGPENVDSGDIDNDGFIDLLVGSRTDDKISWLKNLNGTGQFSSPNVIDIFETRNLSLADLDGDNDLDVLAPLVFEERLVWYENLDGQGTFGPAILIESDNVFLPFELLGADIDGDNDNDIVAAIANGQGAVWYENLDGQGTFGPRQDVSFFIPNCRSIFVADIDGDTDLDVVANSSNNATIVWYENLDGGGTFGPPNEVAFETEPPFYVSDVFLIDIDNDEDLDVIGSTNSASTIQWYENLDGQGTFGPKNIINNQAFNCDTVFSTDLDNDGDNDVIYKAINSTTVANSQILWSENLDGQGTFGPKNVLSNTFFVSRDIEAFDIDDDGDEDIVALSDLDHRVVWFENLTILGSKDFNLSSILMTPNPVNDTLSISSKNNRVLEVAIYQLQGQKLLQLQEGFEYIDVTNLATGTYLVSITTTQGNAIKKLVKE